MENCNTQWKGRVLLFFISQCITLFGSTLVQMAIVWYVTLQTSSGKWVAAFTVCSYVPQMLISFPAGAWADRHDRKVLNIAADGGIALVTLIMWLLIPGIGKGSLLLICLLIMNGIRAIGGGIQTPAVNAIIPMLVPEEQLMRWNGINAAMQSVVQFAAPAAAGLLMTVADLRTVMLTDIFTAVAGIGLFSFVKLPEMARAEKKPVAEDIRLGLRYTFGHPMLGRMLLTFGVFIFFCVPGGFMAQLFVSRSYGDSYWYLTAAEVIGFIGMALGGLLMSIWGGFKKRTLTFALGMAGCGAATVIMAVSGNIVVYLGFMLLMGIALTSVQTASTTLIQENAEIQMQGRLFGLQNSFFCGFLPLGMLLFGPLADVMDMRVLIFGAGVLMLLLALLPLLGKWKSETAI